VLKSGGNRLRFGAPGTNIAYIGGNMLFLLSGVFGLGSMATLALLMGKAPEAYETANGLRIVRPPSNVKLRTATRLPIAQVAP
jgi:hypothetical protein